METKDLMINDLVNFNGANVKIISIGLFNQVEIMDSNNDVYSVFAKDLVPIPPTAEILEKNGFVKQAYDWWLISENNGRRHIEYRTDYFDGLLLINYTEEPFSKLSIKVKYLHELQHALRLCGIDKNIEL